MKVNFCEDCVHYNVCVYVERTNRIANNIAVDVAQYEPNLLHKLICKYKINKTKLPVPREIKEEDTFF